MKKMIRNFHCLHMQLHICCFVIAGLWVTAAAENLLTRIGWKGASLRAGLILLAIMACVGFILLFYYMHRLVIIRADAKEASEKLFRDAVEKAGLTQMEQRKLRSLLLHEKIMEPHTIFQSIILFERCIDAEVKMLLAQQVTAEEKNVEEKLLGSIRKKLGYSFLPFEHPLVSTRNISIGQVGSIFGQSTRIPLIHRAIVTENKEFSFQVQYDEKKEETLILTAGAELKYAFARQHDGFYGIALKVITAAAGMIEFSHTLDLKRNQLRKFVRVEANFPLRVRLLKTENQQTSEIKVGEIIEAKTTDISGGGLSLLTDKSLKVGDTVSVNFNLPNANIAGVAAKVMRISIQEGKTTTYFKHHLQFISIEPRKQEQIVKFVFEKHRQINQWR